jgi:hypothetical protein
MITVRTARIDLLGSMTKKILLCLTVVIVEYFEGTSNNSIGTKTPGCTD